MVNQSSQRGYRRTVVEIDTHDEFHGLYTASGRAVIEIECFRKHIFGSPPRKHRLEFSASLSTRCNPQSTVIFSEFPEVDTVYIVHVVISEHQINLRAMDKRSGLEAFAHEQWMRPNVQYGQYWSLGQWGQQIEAKQWFLKVPPGVEEEVISVALQSRV